MTASSCRAACAPYAGMSRPSAVNAGCTSRHSGESSQATMDSSPGTSSPISWATASAGDGHHVVVVDDRGGPSGGAEQPAGGPGAVLAGVVGAQHGDRVGQAEPPADLARRPRCASRCAAGRAGRPTRAIRRCPSATRYSTVSRQAAASSDQTLDSSPVPPGAADHHRRQPQLLSARCRGSSVAQVARRAPRPPGARPTSAGRPRSRPRGRPPPGGSARTSGPRVRPRRR